MDVAKSLSIKLPSPIQSLSESLTLLPSYLLEASTVNQLELFIKRDDLIHPIISGNKWRKLQGVFRQWSTNRARHIISFGGGYSNHLHALGYACRQLNIPFTAMVRGNYVNNLSPMLQDLIKWQADIRWLTKLDYKNKNDSQWLAAQIPDFQDCLVIPEGGSSNMVHSGMHQLVEELPEDLDYLLCPVGSGGTLAGITKAIDKQKRKTKILGIAVLKGEGYLEDLVQELIEIEEAPTDKRELTDRNWQILHTYHFGGYAKSKTELTQFIQDFQERTSIEVEPVYSGKMMYALYDLIAQEFFPVGSKVCAIHTGGIQGQRKLQSET